MDNSVEKTEEKRSVHLSLPKEALDALDEMAGSPRRRGDLVASLLMSAATAQTSESHYLGRRIEESYDDLLCGKFAPEREMYAIFSKEDLFWFGKALRGFLSYRFTGNPLSRIGKELGIPVINMPRFEPASHMLPLLVADGCGYGICEIEWADESNLRDFSGFVLIWADDPTLEKRMERDQSVIVIEDDASADWNKFGYEKRVLRQRNRLTSEQAALYTLWLCALHQRSVNEGTAPRGALGIFTLPGQLFSSYEHLKETVAPCSPAIVETAWTQARREFEDKLGKDGISKVNVADVAAGVADIIGMWQEA